jgi:Pyruvate/2-oxoacid:ferredoxin oxidoreductase delta subunit
MDAVSAMEGDGPQSGTPRTIGAILASSDYTAMDVILARLIGMDPMEIGTIRNAAARGLVREDLSDIQTVGENPDELKVRDFKKPSTYLGSEQGLRRSLMLAVVEKLGRVYALRPEILEGKCTGCGKCRRICPGHAITIHEGRAEIDLSRCIRCYCCHEMCSDHAIGLSRTRTGTLLAKLIR